jgi:hypothetical protein
VRGKYPEIHQNDPKSVPDRRRKGSSAVEDLGIPINQLVMRFATTASCLVKLLSELLNNVVTLSYLKQMEEEVFEVMCYL